MNFEIIREARKSLHMTQAELADKLEVNRATLSKYENGEIIPPLKQLEKLADVLEISAEDLLRRKVRASTIGDNIKHLRESHGMTQAELGQIAGVTDKAVSTWEADLKVPRMGAVQKMADYFQIPKSVILEGDAAPTIGEKIRKTRIEKGMTQKQVAEKCDMADSAIRKYESGKAVELTPAESGLTVIGGRNNQGKTSCLDAIVWALGGDRMRPGQAQREGSALPPRLRVRLSNGIVVERSGVNGSLKVTDEEGRRAGQRLLDSFVEAFALDMPRFMQATSKEKAATLLRVIGLEREVDELERQEKDDAHVFCGVLRLFYGSGAPGLLRRVCEGRFCDGIP